MSNTRQPQSIFPDYPREKPSVDKDGNLSPLLDYGFGLLFQALQDNFSNEGIKFPLLNQTQITSIQNLYSSYVGGSYKNLTQSLPDISGKTVFNTTTYYPQQFIIAQDNANPPNVNLAQWVNFSIMLFNAGNPNGSGTSVVAGVYGWFCYDTVNKVLYICTTAGSVGTSVWTAV